MTVPDDDGAHDEQVVVVGAGPTGLTAAIVLARSGVPVQVVGAGDGPVRESRALVVHARTLELWHKLGVAEEALARGQAMREAHLMVDGRPVPRRFLGFDSGAGVTPYATALVLEQSETERFLLDVLTAAGGHVRWRTRLTDLAQDDRGVDLTLTGPDGGTERVRAAWVIGADGAGSTVRDRLGLGFVGETYPDTFYLADVDLRWGHGRERFFLDFSAAGMTMFFPMRGGDRFRVIGLLPPALVSKAASGLDLDDVRGLVRAAGVTAELDGARWITTYRIHHRRAERFRSGRVFLAGDAAHVHSPTGGQGMNTGIGDAHNLAWKLARVVAGRAPVDLLDSYEPERVPLADALLRGTDRAFALQASGRPVFDLLRRRLLPRALPLVDRLGPWIFRLISQAWVTYRTSPAVHDAGPRSRVRAGDRAPWAHLPDGTDLYDLLVGTEDHVLVLPAGDPDRDPAAAALVTGARAAAAAAGARCHVIGPDAVELRRRYDLPPGADALLVVRPDGHLGLRSRPADLALLRSHLAGRRADAGPGRSGPQARAA